MSSSDVNRRILLIDDEPDLCRIVKVTLERLKGWEILTADFIQAGLTQAEGKQPDVILLDLTLDGNGLTLLQTLKNNLATQAIPVILFTAANPSEDSLDFNLADIAGIILKPFSVLLLADQIIEQLGW